MKLTDKEIDEIPIQSLAFLGDSVYEICVRTYLTKMSTYKAGALHEMAIKMANASFQCDALKKIEPCLNEYELDTVRHGRNCHTVHTPKTSTKAQYHAATALETLFGRLYLDENYERINELFDLILKEQNDEKI